MSISIINIIENLFSQEMVCLHDEGHLRVTVRDTILSSAKKQSYVLLTPTKTIESIFKEISREFEYNADEIELVLQKRDGTTVSQRFILYKIRFF